MCFSAQADVVAGGTVLLIGADVLRQAHHPHERMLAALPVLLGVHQLTEALVWWGLTDRLAWSTGRAGMWVYLAFALVILPVLVPVAMIGVEPDADRRRFMTGLAVVGVALAIVYLHALVQGPVVARIHGHHISYVLPVRRGELAAAVYALVACGAPLVSSHRRIAAFGVANLVAVAALAWLASTGLTSLWCAWAAVTSLAIAAHLRREHGPPEVRMRIA